MEKYKLGGIFEKQGIHGFLLLNLEATIVLFLTSIATHAVLSVVKTYVFSVTPNSNQKQLNFVVRQIVKKQEEFLWDALPRQLNIYLIQALIFSVLQFRRMYFTSVIEALSSIIGVLVVLSFPVFIYWIKTAPVIPEES